MRISADTEEWPEMDWENKRWSSNIFLQYWAHTVKLEFVLHDVVNPQSKKAYPFLRDCAPTEFWPPFGTCGKLEGTSLPFAWSPLSMKCALITTVNVMWGLPLYLYVYCIVCDVMTTLRDFFLRERTKERKGGKGQAYFTFYHLLKKTKETKVCWVIL